MALKVVDAVDPMIAYRDQARLQIEARQVAEIETLANQLREADERQALHAELRRKHGLPETATPFEISMAQQRPDREFRNAVLERFGNWADPNDYEVFEQEFEGQMRKFLRLKPGPAAERAHREAVFQKHGTSCDPDQFERGTLRRIA